MAVIGSNHQLAFLARERPNPAALGSISALSSFDRTVFAEPCSPDIANSG
jgi:hypothetical protein